MISRTLKASGQHAARLARQQAIPATRAFTTSSIRNADLVQDLYLRELKAYKTPPTKPNDSEGHVHKFSAPAAPKSPEEGDLANDLKAYESQDVEVVGQSGVAEGGSASSQGQDWFEEPDYDEEEVKH